MRLDPKKPVTAPKLTKAQREALLRISVAEKFRDPKLRTTFTKEETQASVSARASIPWEMIDALSNLGLIEGWPYVLTDAGRAALKDGAK